MEDRTGNPQPHDVEIEDSKYPKTEVKLNKPVEDKEAIEAIAKWLQKYTDFAENLEWEDFDDEAQEGFRNTARDLLQTLASLGYVKLAEQKLPEIQAKYTGEFKFKDIGLKAQQDMLSVDSEGCAYRRVYVGGKVK